MSSYVFKIATQDPAGFLAAVSESLGANSRIARQVAEQMPKPAIEEPTAFGSIVRAGWPNQPKGSEHPLWQRTHHVGNHYWANEFGDVEVWSELTDVEVLRVGVGETAGAKAIKDAQADAYRAGAAVFKGRVIAVLRSLRNVAITAERKDAYIKAIEAVEEVA